MKVLKAVEFHVQYQRANSKENSVKNCEFVLLRFRDSFSGRDLESVTHEETLEFLTTLTEGNKQATKRNRYAVLSAFYNFFIVSSQPYLLNPCTSVIFKKIYRRPQIIQWKIIDKETVDEIIFRTMNTRNRLILELMARGGMRIGEVLKLTPADIDDRKLIIQDPKSGKESEAVYIPRKLQDRLKNYVKDKEIKLPKRIFPISYNTAWKMVKNAGKLVGVVLRPHDLRRHAATYASRSGVPIEIISKVILRHADLSTTQRYLDKVNESEAIRWLENLYG